MSDLSLLSDPNGHGPPVTGKRGSAGAIMANNRRDSFGSRGYKLTMLHGRFALVVLLFGLL